MIAFVRGKPVPSGPDSLIIDVGGIGYQIQVPTAVAARLSGSKEEVLIHTYMYVREDAMHLFGFLEDSDRAVFALLLQVSGIGPKVALGIMSAMNAPTLIQAVISEQVAILTGIPGVGKKTAQRIIIELKDRFKKMTALDTPVADSDTGRPDIAGEALQALAVLGYSPLEARRALQQARERDNSPRELADVIKMALKELARRQ